MVKSPKIEIAGIAFHMCELRPGSDRLATHRMLEAVWQSTVVVKVTVYPQIHASHATPFYTTCKRIHYPSHLLPKLSRFYSALGDDTVSQMVVEGRVWFEAPPSCSGAPVMQVRWNQPIGLLCDMAGDGCDWLDLKLMMTAAAGGVQSSSMALGDPQEATKHAFFNSLKEAEAMRRTKQRRVMQLTKHEQQSLWDAVQSEQGNFGAFTQLVCGKLLVVEPKMAPVKVYDCRPAGGERDKMCVRSAPVQLYQEITMHELIVAILSDFDDTRDRVVTHGIALDGKTPVLEVIECLTFPDTMLHLAVL